MPVVYEINQKLKALTAYDSGRGRKKMIYMDANESYLPVPKEIKKEMISRIRRVDINRYPDPKAASCCKAFGAYYGVDPALITAGNGSDELISLILHGFFSHGDKLLLTDPDFSMYGINAQIAELETVVYTKKEDYRIDLGELAALAKEEGCKGIIFSNPCNPSSQGLRKMPIRALLSELPEMLIIIDEAYMDFWNQSLINEVSEFDNLIVLRTASKAIGGAAIRLGFAIANKKITKALQALKAPYNVSSITQAAGQALFKYPDVLKNALMDILSGRGFLAGALTKLEMEWKDSPYAFHLVPESKTNFMVLRFADEKNHRFIYDYLKKQGILIRCYPEFLRVTVGSNEENQAFLTALTALNS